MLVDYHIHTRLCKHARDEFEKYVQTAVDLGITEIGFADHAPMPPWYDPQHRMQRDQLLQYVQLVDEARKAFPEVTIRLGIEADFVPGTEEYVAQLLDKYSFDFVIGSVHYLGDWGFDNPENAAEFEIRGVDSVYQEYLTLLKQAVSSGLFDIVGHFDLVKKFGHRPQQDITEDLKEVLKTVKAHDLVIEVNTSGLRKPVQEIFPQRKILELARDLEIPVTLGSDAHAPEEVGKDFDRAVRLLHQIGYDSLSTFENRTRKSVVI